MRELLTPPEVFDRTLELLERLTAISSPSGDYRGLHQVAACLGEALRRAGLEVEIRDEADGHGAEQPVLYGRGPAARDRYLLAIGHFDTVLSAVTPERRDGRLKATGAIDMKGGLATLVGALELLAREGRAPVPDLLLVVVPDEEVAGHLSHEAVRSLGSRARGLWVLEPGTPREQAETVVIGRRGMFHWRLDVRGRAAHAGNGYWSGRSALDAAAAWCLEVRKLAVPGGGPTVNAGRLIAGDEELISDLATGAALVGTRRQINIVPNRALVEGEARFLSIEDGGRLPAAMAATADRIATEREVEMTFAPSPAIPPLDPRGGGRRWSELAAGLAAAAGWKLEIEDDRGGISFSNFLPDPSAIPILDGLGPVGGGMHTRDEFVDLASLDRRIRLLADLLAAEEIRPENG